MKRSIIVFSCLILLVNAMACKYNKAHPDYTLAGYPNEIGEILVEKCTGSGCHNAQSKSTAAGLNLETWSDMMEGQAQGAVVIPYRSDFSTLFYSLNTFSDLGLSLNPVMPLGSTALSREETELIKNWIDNGAPNSEGFVKYSDNPARKKAYIVNKGCDVVAVVDCATNKIMRYVDVGVKSNIEAPSVVKVSPDGKYWFVLFSRGNVFQKFSTIDNSLLATIAIPYGNWSSFVISNDVSNAYLIDNNSTGKILQLNLLQNSVAATWTNGGNFILPNACALNRNNDTLYVTGQIGNFLYKIPVNNPAGVVEVSLDGNVPTSNSVLDPSQIVFSNDFQSYYVSCQTANEIRVLSTQTDKLLAVIQTGIFPVEMSISATKPYLFVSCMEDSTSNPLVKGNVSVINTKTNSLLKKIYTGHEPKGLAINEERQEVYVINRNVSNGGPINHHSPRCAGKNGYFTIIDINTLDLKPGFKTEVSVDPYDMTITK